MYIFQEHNDNEERILFADMAPVHTNYFMWVGYI